MEGTKMRARRLAILLWAILLALLMAGCGLIEGGKEKVEELMAGSDAGQQMLLALAEGNFEAMCEAVDQGADLDSLPDRQCPNPLLSLLTKMSNRAFISTDLYGNLLNLEYAQYLQEKGADPNWSDNQGHTLLMYCCGYNGTGYPGGMALLELLLSYGADVNARDENGYTALDYRVNDLEAVTVLLDHGAKVTKQTLTAAFHVLQDSANIEAVFAPKRILDAYIAQGGQPDLPECLLAAANGDSDVVVQALETGEIPEEYRAVIGQMIVAFCNEEAAEVAQRLGLTPDNEDGTLGINLCLDIAIQADRPETALLFMEAEDLLPALRTSITGNRPACARFFLEQGALEQYAPSGADWEIFDNLLGDAAAGNLELVQLLVEYSCPTNELAIWQALIRAIYGDSLDIVQYLCEELSAPVSYTYQDNESPFETAAMCGTVEIAEYLVSRGVDIEQEENSLPNAVMKGHTGMVKYLLEQGADPNGAVFAEALHEAVETGRLDLLQMLIEAGGDVNATVACTPILCVAARKPSTHIVQYLLDEGAAVDAKDADGMSPADWALTEDIAQILEQVDG